MSSKTAAEAVFCLVSLDKCNKGAYFEAIAQAVSSQNANLGVGQYQHWCHVANEQIARGVV